MLYWRRLIRAAAVCSWVQCRSGRASWQEGIPLVHSSTTAAGCQHDRQTEHQNVVITRPCSYLRYSHTAASLFVLFPTGCPSSRPSLPLGCCTGPASSTYSSQRVPRDSACCYQEGSIPCLQAPSLSSAHPSHLPLQQQPLQSLACQTHSLSCSRSCWTERLAA